MTFELCKITLTPSKKFQTKHQENFSLSRCADAPRLCQNKDAIIIHLSAKFLKNATLPHTFKSRNSADRERGSEVVPKKDVFYTRKKHIFSRKKNFTFSASFESNHVALDTNMFSTSLKPKLNCYESPAKVVF